MERLQADFLLNHRYRMSHKIARGGMGEVWEAFDTVLDRSVAVKVLHPHTAAEKAFVERFRDEAKLAARLRSPHIVEVYDYGEDSSLAFLVMELVRGTTVANQLEADGVISPARTTEILLDIADALATAHEADVIHRDVKPSNILLSDDGRGALLADFGIARALT